MAVLHPQAVQKSQHAGKVAGEAHCRVQGLLFVGTQVRELAHEVFAHISQAAGPDALLQAFNHAQSAVKAARAERKQQQAVQVGFGFLLCFSTIVFLPCAFLPSTLLRAVYGGQGAARLSSATQGSG